MITFNDVKAVFAKNTIDTIMVDFQKAADKLSALITEVQNRNTDIIVAREELDTRLHNNNAELQRANRIKAKLTELLD